MPTTPSVRRHVSIGSTTSAVWPVRSPYEQRVGRSARPRPSAPIRCAHGRKSTDGRVTAEEPPERPILRALNTASAVLRHWWWGDPGIGDCSLYDAEGLTRARIVLRYLRSPIATPAQHWDGQGAGEHIAESIALASLPLDRQTAARIRRDNSSPHPMGPPLERSMQSSSDAGTIGASTKLAFKTSGPWSDDLAIPEFLRRRRP
jgi:hypothetical protein